MTPEHQERAAAYVLGELDAAAAAALEGALRTDAELAREVEALRRLLGLLPLGAATAPPPGLRARIMEAAATAAAAHAPAARPPSAMVARLVGAMAATLAVALGVDAYRARRELALEHELGAALQEPNVVRAFALAGRGEAAGATGRVRLDLDARKGAVALHGLPALPAERVYRLWAMVDDRAVPCGEFPSVVAGSVVAQFAVPVDAYTAPLRRLFLTVEPPSLPPAPTGPTVMEST